MFKTIATLQGLGCMILVAASALAGPQDQRRRERPSPQEDAYRRGYSAGFAEAMHRVRRHRNFDLGPAYVSEYTPYNPYASQNRPRVSMSAAAAARRSRVDVRGMQEFDDYLDYPGVADYHADPRVDVAPRGRRYDPGDFRDEQGGIYGNRGVLMWTDRYDAGDYANKFWNTHRDAVYAGARVWNANNGDQ